MRLNLLSLRPACLVGCLLVVCGCVSLGTPPVADRSPVSDALTMSYQVRAGDTLYSVAWRHDKDFRYLAQLNGIAAPYRIVVGQTLWLRGGHRTTVTVPEVQRSPPGKQRRQPPPRSSRPSTPSIPEPILSKSSVPAPVASNSQLRWRWPVQAPHSRGFGDGNKGVDFRLNGIAAIVAAAQGEVVYAGAGLGGYAHLVIVKHNANFLSAYGFDARLVTIEGKIVKAGSKLADISTEGAVQSLHFEVRLDGEPVNPATVIAR